MRSLLSVSRRAVDRMAGGIGSRLAWLVILVFVMAGWGASLAFAAPGSLTVPASQAGDAARIPGITLTHGGRGIVADVGKGTGRGEKGPVDGPAPALAGRAVKGSWTATSRTYAPSGGLGSKDRGAMVTRVFAAPVNFQDANGNWQAIDDRLVPVGPQGQKATTASLSAAGAVVNRANAYRAVIPTAAGAPVRVSTDDGWLAFSLVGARGRASVRGSVASFANALPGVSVRYEAQGAGLKESIVLRGSNVPSRYAFDVSAKRGLRLRRRGAELLLVDRRHRAVLRLSSPFAYVQGRHGHGTARGLRVGVSRRGHGWRVSMALDRGWLRRALRRGPVVIDPSVSPGPSQDCTLSQGSPNTSLCAATTDGVGWDGTNEYHAALQFDVASALPDDALVLNAKLGLYLGAKTTSNAKSVSLREINPHAWTTSATWNKYDGTNSWTTAGGDSVSDYTTANSSVGASTGWYYWYPTQMVQVWRDGTSANHGLLLADTTPHATNNKLSFNSSRASGNQPYMDVFWEPRGIGERRDFTLIDTQLTDQLAMSVNPASGDLRLTNSDLSLQGTGIGFAEQRSYDNLQPELLGYGRWASSTYSSLYPWDDGSVTYYAPDGAYVPFVRQSDGSFMTPPGYDMTMCAVGVGTCAGNATADARSDDPLSVAYALKDNRSGLQQDMDSNGRTIAWVDTHDNSIAVQYDGGWSIAGYTDSQGRDITRSYNGDGWTSSLTDWTSRGPSYGYGSPYWLDSYTDSAGKTTTYHQDGNGDLDEITDPNGQRTDLSYDGDHRITAITRVTDNGAGTGPTTTFGYYPGSDTTHGHLAACSTGGIKKTVMTDDNGHAVTYCSNVMDQVTETWDGEDNKRSNGYTQAASLATYTSPLFQGATGTHSLDLDYDPAPSTTNNLIAAKQDAGTSGTPFQLTTTFAYDGGTRGPSGNSQYDPSEIIDPFTKTTGWTGFGLSYDSQRDVTAAGPANGSSLITGKNVVVHHASNGTVDYTKDAAGNQTDYAYSPSGTSELASITPPTGTGLGTKTFTEDGLGRIETTSDGNGNTQTYSYDDDDRVTNIEYDDGSSTNNIGYVYDDDGNVTQRTDDVNGTSYYAYDKLNRVTEEDFNFDSNYYDYDGVGNLTSYSNGGGTWSYGYFDNNQLKQIQEPGAANPITWDQFVPTSSMTDVMHYPNGVHVDTTLDAAGRPRHITATNASSTVLQDLSYDYNDGTGNIEQIHKLTDNLTGNYTTYSYGGANAPLGFERLVEAKTTNSSGSTTISDYTYTYNADGDVTVLNGASKTYNAVHETTGTGNGFDANGNQTATASGPSMSYDSRDHTRSITSGGTTKYLGVLSTNMNELTGEGSDTYQYSLMGLGWHYDNSAGTTAYYTRSPDGQVVGEHIGSTYRYPLEDHHATITAQTNSSGTISRAYTYDPYGNLTATTGTPWDDTIGYAQGTNHTGGLIHYGARLYNPQTIRFTTTDPLGGGLSQDYTYAGDDPINGVDPDGLSWLKCHDLGTGLCKKGKKLVPSKRQVGGLVEIAAGAVLIHVTNLAVVACATSAARSGNLEVELACAKIAGIGYSLGVGIGGDGLHRVVTR